MHARALRTLLLIRAIWERDRSGELLPLADRADATRSVARGGARLADPAADGLSRAAVRFLTERAQLLQSRLLARSPVLADVLALMSGSSHLGKLLLLVAFALGVSLAALDGSRRINILAFPLIALIAWNLFVYLLLIVAWLRSRSPASGDRRAATRIYQRWIGWRVESLLRRSSRFHTPLSAALRHFTSDWGAIARPLIILRGTRLLHAS